MTGIISVISTLSSPPGISSVEFVAKTTPSSQVLSVTSIAVVTVAGPSTVYETILRQPFGTAASAPRAATDNALSVTAIAGGVTGAIAFIIISALLLVHLKRRRQKKKVYQPPMYPSPNPGEDMPQQLRSSYIMEARNNGKEMSARRELGQGLPQPFADLPAEDLIRHF
jgi:hypothetical protein